MMKQKKFYLIMIWLIVAASAVYWQVNKFDFINFDDNHYVTDNDHIKSEITPRSIHWALSTKYFGLWNPLIWLSFMFDYRLFGLTAGGYHLNNLVLHILSSLLLFWLFHRMTAEIWKSAFVASLFALHPLHVESVAWIAERKDVLSAFFWMLTLCLYVFYTEKQTLKRYLLVVGSFILALMSKPMVVTLPAIMILLDYWPLKRFESQKGNMIFWQLKEKAPFFILSAVLVIIIFFLPDSNKMTNPDLTYLPLLSRLANTPVAFATYLGKTFVPQNLAIFYPYTEQIPFGHVLGTSFLIVAVTIIVITMAKRLPYLFTGWFWFVIAISPVIGIIQISISSPYAMADRYHYLPSIGIAVGLAWGIPSLIKNKSIRKNVLFPATITFLAILAIISWKQCGYWKNSITVFDHALSVTKNNALANNNLATALAREGDVQAAVHHYKEAVRINPDYAEAYYNMGTLYCGLEQYEQAIGNFSEAIHLKPDYTAAYNNRAFAYLNMSNTIPAADSPNASKLVQLFHINLTKSGCLDAEKACRLGNCKIWEAPEVKMLCHIYNRN